MTSWPWMKGVGAAIADLSVDPVTEYDDRPCVKDLIEKHRHGIDAVRSILKEDPLYDATKHDDLWILRFWLSHRHKAKAAANAAKKTLIYRAKYKLDNHDLRPFTFRDSDNNNNNNNNNHQHPNPAVQKYLSCWDNESVQLLLPDSNRGIIFFCRPRGLRPYEMLERCTEEDRFLAFSFVSEWSFQWLDYITRTTGRFTKSARMFQMEGFTMANLSYKNSILDCKAMLAMEDYYPQLVQCMYFCNVAFWAWTPYKVLKVLLPKRVVEKVDFITKENPKHRKRLLAHIAQVDLPTCFGGTKEDWD